MLILEAKNVKKSYGPVRALEDFSIEINDGEIIALLGPNGAGKTTFVKSVLGLLRIDSGEINLFEGALKGANSRKELSYLPEKFTFYDYFTIDAALKFFAQMNEVDSSIVEERIVKCLDLLSILDLREKKIKELSKGQLQRVGLACTIIGDQKFIILDEPFSGLDPIGIKEVKDLCRTLKEEGKTILINSHILSEMELIADRAIILDKGTVKAYGTISEVCHGASLEQRFYELIKGESSDQ